MGQGVRRQVILHLNLGLETEGGQDSLNNVQLFPGVAYDTIGDFYQVIKHQSKH